MHLDRRRHGRIEYAGGDEEVKEGLPEPIRVNDQKVDACTRDRLGI